MFLGYFWIIKLHLSKARTHFYMTSTVELNLTFNRSRAPIKLTVVTFSTIHYFVSVKSFTYVRLGSNLLPLLWFNEANRLKNLFETNWRRLNFA